MARAGDIRTGQKEILAANVVSFRNAVAVFIARLFTLCVCCAVCVRIRVSAQAKDIRLEGGFDFARIARYTPGFVGADLLALTKEAAAVAVARIFSKLLPAAPAPASPDDPTAAANPAAAAPPSLFGAGGRGPLTPKEMSGLAITMTDYEAALGRVQPSAQREGFATVPDVSWEARRPL